MATESAGSGDSVPDDDIVERSAVSAGAESTRGNRATRTFPLKWQRQLPRFLAYQRAFPAQRPSKTRHYRKPALTIESKFYQGEFELFQFAEFPPTIQLTQDAESSRSRRFVFSASHARTYVESVLWREFSKLPRGALRSLPWSRLSPELSRSLVNKAVWLTQTGWGLCISSGSETNTSRYLLRWPHPGRNVKARLRDGLRPR